MRKGGFVTVSSSGFDSGGDFLGGDTELASGGTAIDVTSIAFGVLIETASGRTALAFGNVLPAVISSWRHAAAEVSRLLRIACAPRIVSKIRFSSIGSACEENFAMTI